MACRKRDVEELGVPSSSYTGEATGYGLQLLRHRKGIPGDGTMLEPTCRDAPGARKAEKYWRRERPRYAASAGSRIERSTLRWGKPTTPGKDSTEARRPDRPRIPDMSDRNRMSQPPCGP